MSDFVDQAAANYAVANQTGVNKNGYDGATSGKGRRRQANINLKHEDKVLKPFDRDLLISNARLLRRNASIVRWGIDKHLDYIATHSFRCGSDNPAVNQDVENLWAWYCRPLNCDVSGRHSFQRLMRLAESHALVEGDVFISKLSDGRLQIIEGDRVRTPSDLGTFTKKDINVDDFYHGVKATPSGKPLIYSICERTDNGSGSAAFRLSSLMPAQYIYQHGYFDRYEQIRGISPLASAINTFCDVYEATEYALSKMKLAQLFGIKLTRQSTGVTNDPPTDYGFDFGKGPVSADLDPGDDLEFIESQSPSIEFQSFLHEGIAMGLKSIDIPYSFYDEAHSNYSGSRQALLQYEQSADRKREQLKLLMNSITAWRLGLFIADGTLKLPDGMTIQDLKWDYIPQGLPWIDPLKEANSNVVLLNARVKSRKEICAERGRDIKDVIDEIAAEEAYIKSKGLTIDPLAVVTPNDGYPSDEPNTKPNDTNEQPLPPDLQGDN